MDVILNNVLNLIIIAFTIYVLPNHQHYPKREDCVEMKEIFNLHIINLIFSYDPTYRNIYNKVIKHFKSNALVFIDTVPNQVHPDYDSLRLDDEKKENFVGVFLGYVLQDRGLSWSRRLLVYNYKDQNKLYPSQIIICHLAPHFRKIRYTYELNYHYW
jgi:hypothetical protein